MRWFYLCATLVKTKHISCLKFHGISFINLSFSMLIDKLKKINKIFRIFKLTRSRLVIKSINKQKKKLTLITKENISALPQTELDVSSTVFISSRGNIHVGISFNTRNVSLILHNVQAVARHMISVKWESLQIVCSQHLEAFILCQTSTIN